MRQLVYFIACSVDGFIADQNDSFAGFLQSGAHLDDLVKRFPETIPTHLRRVLKLNFSKAYDNGVLLLHYSLNVSEVLCKFNSIDPP